MRWAESSQKSWPRVFSCQRNPVFLDEREEIEGGVAGQGGSGEMEVVADEVFGAGAEVGEVAAAAAGDEDLAAGALAVVEEQDAATAAAGLDGPHQPCRAGAQHNDAGV